MIYNLTLRHGPNCPDAQHICFSMQIKGNANSDDANAIQGLVLSE